MWNRRSEVGMRPTRTRSVIGAALGVTAVIGLLLLGPVRGSAVGPTSTDSSIVASSTTEALVPAPPAVDGSLPAPPPVVVAAAGDLSCQLTDTVTPKRCQAGAVSDALLALPDLQQFFALGDLQYVAGSLDDFTTAYELTYGRLKAITRPAVGNHEYQTPDAAGYFAYFGASAGTPGEGWYSVDLGSTWHVVVLNSNCGRVPCDVGSAQEQWLRADLAASARPCTIGVWHHPLFSSGGHHGGDPRTAPLWQALLDDGAELVLNGHDHDYERFAPQLADGTPSDLGLRAFVVGTGGRSLHAFASPVANSEVRVSSFGHLRLDLGESGYDFAFAAPDGTVLDQGSGTCHEPAA
jgi:hypothetical protein